MTVTRATVLLVLLGLLGEEAISQPLYFGPRLAGLSGASAALSTASYGLGNPASRVTPVRLGLAFAVSRSFGLSELDHVLATGTLRSRPMSIGVTVESFGFEDYRLLTGHLTVAVGLVTSSTELAVRASYRRLQIGGYGTLGYHGLTAGIRLDLGPTFQVGTMVDNLVRNRSDMADCSRRLVLGIGFVPAEHVLVLVDVMKSEPFDPGLRVGLEIAVFGHALLRGGFATLPQSFSIGLGAKFGGLQVDAGSLRHRSLGWARSVGFAIAR